MIRIPSVNYGEGKGDEKEIAEFVSKFLSDIGIQSKIIFSEERRANVIAEIKNVLQQYKDNIIVNITVKEKNIILPNKLFINNNVPLKIVTRKGWGLKLTYA